MHTVDIAIVVFENPDGGLFFLYISCLDYRFWGVKLRFIRTDPSNRRDILCDSYLLPILRLRRFGGIRIESCCEIVLAVTGTQSLVAKTLANLANFLSVSHHNVFILIEWICPKLLSKSLFLLVSSCGLLDGSAHLLLDWTVLNDVLLSGSLELRLNNSGLDI